MYVRKSPPAALPLSHRRMHPAIQNAIESLECRGYLSGVVFGTPQNITTASAGIAPVFVALSDVNGDNKPDLITANGPGGSVGNSVSVMPGNGNGTFAGAQTLALPSAPTTL